MTPKALRRSRNYERHLSATMSGWFATCALGRAVGSHDALNRPNRNAKQSEADELLRGVKLYFWFLTGLIAAWR